MWWGYVISEEVGGKKVRSIKRMMCNSCMYQINSMFSPVASIFLLFFFFFLCELIFRNVINRSYVRGKYYSLLSSSVINSSM